jgi:hypothetical protein
MDAIRDNELPTEANDTNSETSRPLFAGDRGGMRAPIKRIERFGKRHGSAI